MCDNPRQSINSYIEDYVLHFDLWKVGLIVGIVCTVDFISEGLAKLLPIFQGITFVNFQLKYDHFLYPPKWINCFVAASRQLEIWEESNK